LKTAKNHKSQRGIALLMVLIALTILGAMTADFMETNEVYLANTVNHKDAVKAEYLARSGVNLSRLALSVQPLLGGSLNFPFWQYADLLLEPFTDPEGEAGLLGDMAGITLADAEGLGIKDGDFSVLIVDEDSKINVNVGAVGKRKDRVRLMKQLGMLMAPREYDEMFDRQDDSSSFFEREEIVCELLDWADPDEELCDQSGGEDETYYSRQDPEYERKNAPYDSLEELQFIKGVGDDFWSAFVDPDPTDPEKRVLTVWGKGRVNVNTAPAQVLFAQICMLSADESGISPCMDMGMRFNLLQILQGAVMIRTFMPFSKVGDFIKAVENPEERLFLPITGFPVANKREARRVLTTESTVFSIYSEGTVGKTTRRIHAVVDMEGLDMLNPTQSVAASGGKVLYWRTE
jgi:general secretion pathway protein K